MKIASHGTNGVVARFDSITYGCLLQELDVVILET